MQRCKEKDYCSFSTSCFSVSLLLVSLFLSFSSVGSQELVQQESSNQPPFKTATLFSYRLQKYTGFNLIVDFLAEALIKSMIKLKTQAKEVYLELSIYSGLDLFKKKASSFTLRTNKLFIKDIPIEHFELMTFDPIYFKKGKEKKYRVLFPVRINSLVKVDLSDVVKTLNSLPKWEKVFKELELPIPPFGTTRVTLDEFNINVDNNGYLQVASQIRSLENPSGELLKIKFEGNLVVREKRIEVSDLKTEIEDIFTIDSEAGKSFSEFLIDLINPVIDLGKYEGNGLTIDNVKMLFETQKMILTIGVRLLPEEDVGEVR